MLDFYQKISYFEITGFLCERRKNKEKEKIKFWRRCDLMTEIKCQNVLGSYVTKLLIFLGFSPRTGGFNYLKEMILIYFKNQNLKLAQIYPVISRIKGQPPDAIQTAIRTALKNSFNQGGNSQLELLL